MENAETDEDDRYKFTEYIADEAKEYLADTTARNSSQGRRVLSQRHEHVRRVGIWHQRKSGGPFQQPTRHGKVSKRMSWA
jgi:hypothetical protein